MSEDESGGTSKRAELKKLLFQKKQDMQKCKNKADREKMEVKYAELEAALVGKAAPKVALDPECVETQALPTSLYSDAPKEVSKAQLKKERKQEKLREQREQVIQAVGDGSAEAEIAKAELDAIMNKIPEGYRLVQVEPNGDCMYESLRLSSGVSEQTCTDIRNSVAVYLDEHRGEFEAFITEDFDTYLDGIRGSTWGSDLELEIASRIYRRRIKVITSDREVEFGLEFLGEPIYLSFHERQYSSNHYNAVLR